MNIVASTPEGLEDYLSQEIINLGGKNIKKRKRHISFQCNYETFYKLHFYSKIAFRFYREVARFACLDRDDLYNGIQSSFDWVKWLPPNKDFCVQASGKSSLLNHSHFNALQVKNAIVDLQNSHWGQRSNVSVNEPYLIIHLHISNDEAIVSLQSTDQSLHKRGYRPAIGNAPLKENVAAGLIQITKWNGDRPLIDLMCGSGTFLIEAALQALKMPLPIQKRYLFENWVDFERELYSKLKSEANQVSSVHRNFFNIEGYEINHEVYLQAKNNINMAGLSKLITLHNKDFAYLLNNEQKGIVICNPPYGKKLFKDKQDLIDLYTKIGKILKEKFSGWEFWMLSGNSELTQYLRLKSSLKIPVSNGGLDCRWIKYVIR